MQLPTGSSNSLIHQQNQTSRTFAMRKQFWTSLAICFFTLLVLIKFDLGILPGFHTVLYEDDSDPVDDVVSKRSAQDRSLKFEKSSQESFVSRKDFTAKSTSSDNSHRAFSIKDNEHPVLTPSKQDVKDRIPSGEDSGQVTTPAPGKSDQNLDPSGEDSGQVTTPAPGKSDRNLDPSLPVHRTPDALILGASKCGTRAVLVFLKMHPSVVTANREMDFFSDDEYYNKGLDAYAADLPVAAGDKTLIEKSPSYLDCDECPSRVKSMSPSTKMIALLCDPVPRLVSQFMQCQRKGTYAHLPDTFEEWVTSAESGDIKDENAMEVLRKGSYARSLEFWLDYFPQKQIHVIDSQDLLTDPASVMTQLEKFLELPTFFKPTDFFYNETKGFFCVNNTRWAGPPCLGEDKGHKEKISIDPDIEKRLQDFYREQNQRLHNLLGHKMSWEK